MTPDRPRHSSPSAAARRGSAPRPAYGAGLHNAAPRTPTTRLPPSAAQKPAPTRLSPSAAQKPAPTRPRWVRTPAPAALPAPARPAATPDAAPEQATESRPWLPGWRTWAVLIVLVSGGLGFTATALLLKLPAVPNCPAIFWPTASASMRLYCAQLAANKRTEADLLEAIALVSGLPDDHPLRGDIDRHLEEWIDQLLVIGEEHFQDGDLAAAIALANKVSSKVSDPALVAERIQNWQAVWQEGEALEAQARREMRDSRWGVAFQTAARLTKLNNRYWATTRYDSLYAQINLAREESRKLDAAFVALERGGLDNLLKAIELAQTIPVESTARGEAQTLIREAGDRLLALARRELDAGNWQAVANIASRMPRVLNMEDQAADLGALAKAGLSARLGTTASFEDAIAEAQRLGPGRPLFETAQGLIARWQLAREAAAVLERADALASYGDVSSLTAAIAQAQAVTPSNPRYADAQAKIADWQGRIQMLQDRPFLERAVELAQAGGSAAWRQAVDQASAIESGSPLYNEAQDRIREWRSDIQADEDRDRLARADAFADAGNLSQALATVQQIGSTSPLAAEAQNRIERWQGQVRAEQTLQRAYQIASAGSAEGISQAISLAQQVPSTSSLSAQASQAVERWSEQLLVLAQRRATVNLREAVAIARRIPSTTVVYRTARLQIELWERTLAGSL